MVLLAIDGNSIINRAFYGIKLLSTKSGKYTNGIYGFMNILLSLRENYKPDSVAVAFDLKAPTFRHKMYDGYKAGRKGMPPELCEQMPVLKEILHTMGIKTIEVEGWEADDILGTLSVCNADKCYIATGDRDSLQLVSDKTTVLLTSTKMGRTQTVEYDKAKLFEDYSMTPELMIDLKALMGDTSDNIPGVPGIGQKTATDLILKYGSVENIFSDLDKLDVTKSVRAKLENGRESAFLSYTLGTISKEVPIECDCSYYRVQEGDPKRLRTILTDLEMYKMIDRLGLTAIETAEISTEEAAYTVSYIKNPDTISDILKKSEVYFDADINLGSVGRIIISDKKTIYDIENNAKSIIADLLANKDIKKYTVDSKKIYRYCFENGITAENIVFDSIIAGYLLNPNSSDYSVFTSAADNRVALPQIENCDSPDDMLKTVALLPGVSEKLLSQLEANEQTMLYNDIELPLAEVLASMEYEGFRADKNGISDFGEKLGIRIDSLMAEIYDEAGERFNINSPKQLGVILFEKLGLPVKKKTKTGYSTNAEVLESLASENPIVEKILEYRSLSKLKSTYCDSLVKVIGEDGRIHTTFNQTETRTGRISSSEPNLQNIPVRSEIGREMRRFFIANDGCMLADADYSQIELRVLADIADDSAMINAFNKNEDIHAVTASEVFDLPLEMINSTLRGRAKAVNFGIVYGIGAFSLAKDIGVSRFEADKYIKSYLAHYSGVDAYMKNVIEKSKECGYSETVFHRRRYLPELSSSNGLQRAFGERVARNMPIQGTAADIIKIAMVRVFDRLRRENLKSKLILQVHDELIVEVVPGEEEQVSSLLSFEMENAVKLKVALVADVHIGSSWYEAKG